MIRLNIVVEGHSEEKFVRDILGEYLATKDIYVCARRVKTGRKPGKDYRGGVTTYAKIKNDCQRWLTQDSTAYLSTFFDLYGLPNDFPNFIDSKRKQEPIQRVNCLERGFKNDIKHEKFLPYIQLYEFEGLLFSNVQAVDECITLTLDVPSQLKRLHKIRNQYPTPEHINDGANTAPSKRLKSLYLHYDKVLHGSLISELIGLQKLRQECQHFDNWISRLENLAS